MAALGKIGINFVGKSGLRVSNVCLGSGTFGDNGQNVEGLGFCDEKESHAILDRFVEWGGNFIDTADVYANGNSEKIIGSWLKKQERSDFVIATKMFLGNGPANQNSKGLSRVNILRSIEGSLHRLQTSYVDIYYIHCWDNATPLEESLSALNDLVRSGKVRYIGASNLSGWQLQKIIDVTKAHGWDQWICLEQQWNLMSRHSEPEAFEVCRHEGIGVIPWSPLKGGLLTGKYTREMAELPPGTRLEWAAKTSKFDECCPNFDKYKNNETFLNTMELLGKYAEEHGKTVPQVALKWLLQKSIVPSIVIGARTIAQLDDNMHAGTDWKLTAEQMSALDDISAPEPVYPYDIIRDINKMCIRDRLPSLNT